MRHMLTSTDNRQGFTIAELLVVMTVLGLLISVVLITLGDFYDSNNRTLVTTVQNGDAQTALRRIADDVSTAAGFLTANTITDPTLSGGWDYEGNDSSNPGNRVLILSTYATTDTTSSRSLLYAPGSCDQPLTNNLVYFVSSGILYRRTIKNTTTPCSGAIGQKQSCAVGATSPSCKATDARIMANVTAFSIDYYASPTDSDTFSDQYTSVGATTIESSSTKTITVSITSSQRVSGKATTATNSFRVNRQN